MAEAEGKERRGVGADGGALGRNPQPGSLLGAASDTAPPAEATGFL